MKNKADDLPVCMKHLVELVGDSSEESRAIVQEAHGGIEVMQEVAQEWAKHHGVFCMSESDTFVAYAAAVDMGCRIGITKKP